MPFDGTRPLGLLVACCGTWISALGLLAIAVGALLQWHGVFSAGIAAALTLYSLLLAWIGWAGWRRRSYARGPLVASSLLQLGVVLGSDRSGAELWWAAAGVIAAGVLIGSLLPATSAALGVERWSNRDGTN